MWEVFYNSKIMGFIPNKGKFFPDNDPQLNCVKLIVVSILWNPKFGRV